MSAPTASLRTDDRAHRVTGAITTPGETEEQQLIDRFVTGHSNEHLDRLDGTRRGDDD